ncbi:hypothetical protein PYCCODRAFT_539843 [Trametes coccinea BRFM310]|uniref:Uncharacterized protein n=1 Tax=Trametes coccinea (strain BRFM310) TaxID=1353009 RepID=A0A1Y2IM59_TRAC3|nr:hypothetical protein PYCCODRAFT_539843 [Trametes coccinea BRFM310]
MKGPGGQIDRALRRTRSFSVHVLANSAKTLKAGPVTLKNQIASKGKTVLHRRAMIHHELPAPIREESESSNGEVSFDSNSDQSSSDEGQQSQDTASSAGSSSAGSSAADSTSTAPPAAVSHTPIKRKARRTPRQSSTRSRSTRPRTSHHKSPMPPKSAPSTPERRAQPGNRSPQVKERRLSLRIRGGKAQPDEPVRYSRPACPENMISGVVFETRYENPIKAIFNSKKKGAAGGTRSPNAKTSPASSRKQSISSQKTDTSASA